MKNVFNTGLKLFILGNYDDIIMVLSHRMVGVSVSPKFQPNRALASVSSVVTVCGPTSPPQQSQL